MQFGSSPQSVTGAASTPAQRPQFRVALFGLNYKFQRLLEIIVRHARHNQYQFVLAGSRGPGDYDIAMVDMTVKGGPEVASTLHKLVGKQSVVRLGRRADPARPVDDLAYQNFTLHVLGALNRVVDSGLVRRTSNSIAQVADAVRREFSRESARNPATTAAAVPSAPRPAMLRALIVDDSPTVRRQLSLALQQMGLETEAVGMAQEALDVLALRRYDIVFADVMMPEMDGYKLTKTIKRDRALRKIPVVILTSRASPFDLARGAFAGCNSYLVKPVSLKALKQTVLKNLSRSTALDMPLPAALRMV
jgi:CheY-like chemotaxis protein